MSIKHFPKNKKTWYELEESYKELNREIEFIEKIAS